MLGPCFTAWSSSDHVLWTCLCHWNNHLCFTALKGSFWLGVFLSDGIGKFMKLHARRRLCNRKIISLLAAVPASANEPSFPFGLRSDWSLRPCSPWMCLSSDFTLLLCSSQLFVASWSWLLCHTRGGGYCSQSPADEAGEKPWSTHGPKDPSWGLLTEVPAGLTWRGLAWGRTDV